MENFIRAGKKIFSEVMNRYSLKFIEDNSRVFSLQGKDFSINFYMETHGTTISYNFYEDEKHILIYDFDWYIGSCVDEVDRKKGSEHKRGSILDVAISDLYILESCLSRHFVNMLEGNNSWIKDYEKSQYYKEPRIYVKEML